MMDKKEKQVVLYYLNNLSRKSFSKNKEDEILSWVESNAEDLFGIDLGDKWQKRGRRKYIRSRASQFKLVEDEKDYLERSMKTLRDILAGEKISDITAQGYDKGMEVVFNTFKIASDYQAILRYMVYCERLTMLNDFNSSLLERFRTNRYEYPLYAALAGVSIHAIEKSFAFDGPLVMKGIVKKENDGDISASDSFRKLLHSRCHTESAIKKTMLGEVASATLARDNFKYIGSEYDYISTILGNALRERKVGVNILLYGIPGTGKTELCKAITKNIEADLYMLSETAENDSEARVSELSLAQTLLLDDPNAVILFDEAEDAFRDNPFARIQNSKIYFNRMLEKNKTPVLWVSNNIDDMDPAYIRRFKYALEVKKPDQAAKETIWKNICARHHLKLPAGQIAAYAKQYDIAPSFIDTAVGAASLVKSADAIERTIDSLQKATLGFVPRKKAEDEIKFLPELLNTDAGLVDLAAKLVKKGSLKFSLCLYGAPGTGKSAFARYLADMMGLQVVQKRASDLMSMWVGQTEKNIARAFNEAYASKSLLVFDEADSFLRSRKGAERSWEVTQVNEMLTWMESHPYPFICTTNLMKDLDEASLRRFTFKVNYGYLKPEQLRLAFQHFFGVEAEASLAHLTHLTPGDFAVVKGKRDILDIADKAELVRMLGLEQAAKGVKTGHMGFV